MQTYIGQILLFAFPRVPDGWAVCNGALQSISQNEALYQLLGTTYGGDGITTFALPDLRGRVPLHQGQGTGLSMRLLGEIAGQEGVTLLGNNLPSHNHQLQASPSSAGATATPGPAVEFATAAGVSPYAPGIGGATPEVMAANSIGPSGGNVAHNNMMPTLIMNYCISLYGVYPTPG